MKSVGLDIVRVTESAAIAASAWIGSGNKIEADRAATDAMRARLNEIKACGTIRVGEGIKDKSIGLYKGEQVGLCWDKPNDVPYYDVAIDPIDGTTPTVNSGPEAMSVIAIAENKMMFDTEEFYMLKLAVSGEVASKVRIDLTMSIDELCKRVAFALNKPIDKLMVCILNRPRHEEYIQRMRSIGVRIKLIQDCDISGAITAASGGDIDMQFGIGGAPEAVITAAAVKCLRGHFLSQIWTDGVLSGLVYNQNDLVKGDCTFAATGVTNGSLLRGVSWTSRGPVTHSVFMRSESGTIRWLETNHGN